MRRERIVVVEVPFHLAVIELMIEQKHCEDGIGLPQYLVAIKVERMIMEQER